MVQCPHPGGAGAYERGRGAGSSPVGSTPTHRHRSRLAAAPGSPCEGARQRTSTGGKKPSSVWREAAPRLKLASFVAHLNLHVLGLDDVDFVLVAAPNLIVDHSHAADGVVRTAEVHEVVVGQIPLTIWTATEWKLLITPSSPHIYLKDQFTV